MKRREEEKRGNEGGQRQGSTSSKDKRLAHPGKPVEMEKRGNEGGQSWGEMQENWWKWRGEKKRREEMGGQSRGEHLEQRQKAGTSRKTGGNGEESRKEERK